MKWFKRGAEAINQADPATDLVIALTPSIRRVRRLEERGTPANGVITGIRFSLNDSTVRKEFAVSVQGADGWRRFGVRTQPVYAHRLRLGVPVVVKVDGDRAILDWDAMAAAWGLNDQFLSQESIRQPPDDGVVDNALDIRVQSHLKKWTPTEATIDSLERRTVMGMSTMNWNITLDLGNGRTAVSKGDEVPSYAQWFAAPGMVVPAVVDPKDSSKASIDWPTFAIAQFDSVGFDDDPPPGSIAAEVESDRDANRQSAMSAAPQPPVVDPNATVTIDATMQGWIDATKAGYMKPKEAHKAINDWASAGMCTLDQAEAAKSALEL